MSFGLQDLFLPRLGRSRRISSTDPTGANRDNRPLPSGERLTIAHIEGAGIIRHIWCTISCRADPNWPRQIIVRMYWDGAKSPSVQCPIGDFFGVGHGKVSHYASLPLNMVTGGSVERDNSAAMNCYFPMPFHQEARIEFENLSSEDVFAVYYAVDYEAHERLPEEIRWFHAGYRQESPTDGTGVQGHHEKVFQRRNRDGRENFVFVDTKGRGQFVGLVLSIDNIDPIKNFGWFGEGDDWFRIDGERRPSLQGTGTEDYFGAAWGFPSGAYSFPYHGLSLAGETQWYSGQWTAYRFHIEDPILFSESLHGSIEHGHANCHSNDYSSVAFWYQAPRTRVPKLPAARKLIARSSRESQRLFWRGH